MDPQVPLVVPTVNPSHLDILPAQQKACGIRKGYIVTNANCSTTGMVVALKPLHEAFGIAHMHVTTMQAISGIDFKYNMFRWYQCLFLHSCDIHVS
jgi:aspartate-semialdehyde dehydrogenase